MDIKTDANNNNDPNDVISHVRNIFELSAISLVGSCVMSLGTTFAKSDSIYFEQSRGGIISDGIRSKI